MVYIGGWYSQCVLNSNGSPLFGFPMAFGFPMVFRFEQMNISSKTIRNRNKKADILFGFPLVQFSNGRAIELLLFDAVSKRIFYWNQYLNQNENFIEFVRPNNKLRQIRVPIRVWGSSSRQRPNWVKARYRKPKIVVKQIPIFSLIQICPNTNMLTRILIRVRTISDLIHYGANSIILYNLRYYSK